MRRLFNKVVIWKGINCFVFYFIFKSPDGKWKINLREISSSEEEIAQAGYKVESTLDVIDQTKKRNNQKEIKFILLKY